MKKKNIFFSIILLAILAVIGYRLFLSYCADHPDIYIQKGGRHVGDHNIEIIGISYAEKFNVPLSKKVEDNLREFMTWDDKVVSTLSKDYMPPMDIKVYARSENGKTTATYSGFATNKKTGKKENFKEEKTFDFILTKDNKDELFEK